jgi:hypothetical protein
MPLIETKGAASAQGFGEFATSSEKLYIESCFSTWLYTGNGSTQTITNGIDLSTKGGLVWMKGRSGATDHALYDTTRGATKDLVSNSTAAETTQSTGLTAFNTTGFAIGTLAKINTNAATYVSWTFRKQPKFFDVVTYTGDGSNRTISHSLGSVPGCIIVKRTDTTADWQVYHRSLANTEYIVLNTTAAKATGATRWNSTTPTSSVFSLGTDSAVNASGGTYVAYLFAHDAGGFGLSGTDNVISCGSYTGTGAAGNAITTGYEPQYLLIKNTSSAASWFIYDVMRGLSVGGPSVAIIANTSDAEGGTATNVKPTATGFVVDSTSGGLNASGNTYIYIAIRRGPMKVPTSGTSVFSPNNTSVSSGSQKITTTFPVDTVITKANQNVFEDRLRGAGKLLYSTTTGAEGSGTTSDWQLDFNDGYEVNAADVGPIKPSYAFRRAPGFFDICCFTATGSNFSVTHNLGVVPELVITKERNGARSWYTYSAGAGNTKYLALDGPAAATTGNAWQDTTPTSTTLYLTGGSSFFSMSQTYVAYLFASCPGVSKVGSYTGTGTTLQIDCGFTGGARFILIKRTDSTGNWYVYDTARGIVAGNDPYFFLNSTAAEVTNTDYVDTYSAGFELSSTAPLALNANGGTYIFLAIA